MIPQTVNDYPVIAVIEIDTKMKQCEEMYLVVNQTENGHEKYCTWHYIKWEESTKGSANWGYYTASRVKALENMIERSGFALVT